MCLFLCQYQDVLNTLALYLMHGVRDGDDFRSSCIVKDLLEILGFLVCFCLFFLMKLSIVL